MKNYNDFVNGRLNEEKEFGGSSGANKIGGLLKNLLGGLVKDLTDEFKKPLEDFNKKLGNQKDKDSVIKVVNDYLANHKVNLDKTMEESKTIPDIVKTIESNLKTAYGAIESTVTNFGNDKYTFEEIFADAPDRTKKLMSSNPKKFPDRVIQFSKDLVLSFGKPYGVTKEDVNQEPEKATDQNQKEQTDEAAPDLAKQGEGQGTEQTGTEKVEHLHSDYTDKLFEAINEDDIPKLKADIIKWFDNTIYKNTKNSLEEVRKEEPEQEGSGDLNTTIDNMSVDVNKDSVKKMVDKLATSDKNTIIKVRDMLGLDADNAPL